jgi:hypothetical protein
MKTIKIMPYEIYMRRLMEITGKPINCLRLLSVKLPATPQIFYL